MWMRPSDGGQTRGEKIRLFLIVVPQRDAIRRPGHHRGYHATLDIIRR